MKTAQRIEEAMAIIGDYCSFFNYHIVELIIDILGTTNDKESLSNYKKEFSEYARRHVYECPSELGTVTTGDAELFMTLDETYDSYTVSSLQLFVRKLAEILKLSSDAGLKLCRIELGSLKLTFQIPLFVQKDIFPLSIDQKRALAGLGVVHLSCGDHHFTNKVGIHTFILYRYSCNGKQPFNVNLWCMYLLQDEELKLSGSVAAGSEVTDLVADLTVGKSDDAESIVDSILGSLSVVSEATSTGVSTSSCVST